MIASYYLLIVGAYPPIVPANYPVIVSNDPLPERAHTLIMAPYNGRIVFKKGRTVGKHAGEGTKVEKSRRIPTGGKHESVLPWLSCI